MDPSSGVTAAEVAHRVLEGLMAQAGGGQAGGFAGLLMPIALMVAIFYFFMWRPQQKQQKEHREMLSSLKKGDEVITEGGLLGRVYAVADKYLLVEVARDVRIRVLKGSVKSRIPEGTLGEAEAKPEKDK